MVQRNKCLNLDETGLEEISQDGTALSEKIMPNGSGIQPNRDSDNVLDGSGNVFPLRQFTKIAINYSGTCTASSFPSELFDKTIKQS